MRFADLMDEEYLEGFFQEHLSELKLPQQIVRSCKVTPLKLSKRGGKSVLDFELLLEGVSDGEASQLNLVGIWRPDSANAPVFDLMRWLWSSGFDGRDAYAICQPIAYLDDSNLMLVAKLEDVELDRFLRVDTEAARLAVDAAGRWLAKLHRTLVRGPLAHSVARERELLSAWVRDLGNRFPAYARRLPPLARGILKVEGRVAPDQFTLIHGDFHPENIFVNDDRVTVTDFERSCLFDPAQDLGFFLGQLAAKTRMGRYPGGAKYVRRLGDRFLNAYARERSPDLDARIAAYEAR